MIRQDFLDALLADFKEQGLLEDRLEYSIEDFQSSYLLSVAEATALYAMVQATE